MVTSNPVNNMLFEDDAFTASQSLEEELVGKGYLTETPLGSSLAAELHSATTSISPLSPTQSSQLATVDRLPPNAVRDTFHSGLPLELDKPSDDLDSLPRGVSHSLADEVFSNQTSPVMSPLQWSFAMSTSTSAYGRSRRSSFSSTWSSLEVEDDDPFEMLKRQLEELNSAVWETKTLHKRLFNTLLTGETQVHAQKGTGALMKNANNSNFAPPLELVITSVISLVERKSRDRERQVSYLRSLDSSIRKEGSLMTIEAIKDLEVLVMSMKSTLHDQTYSYENPLPVLRSLNVDTISMTESLEELKELMYVNKRQVQELNSRLRSIAKTVHEVRKDIRRINKFLEEKDDEDAIVLEKGEVEERVKQIMWGLDDLDENSTRKLKQMQLFWEKQIADVC
ncbi:hypothetical protein DFQ28_005966 [Apophysomyces sp. BC1034]|nr:hypothetical protein DFQ30_007256 [Apophysomyces sp. BC1015]KAG0176358.1 hypothetical protein DFQ29_006216 [Apophysomyces sp. BC1021]KAG0187692.1 hypothetical protein DFQ28_005966 [Apophysomyces sp. BC1034]